jgi:hypothetical protein
VCGGACAVVRVLVTVLVDGVELEGVLQDRLHGQRVDHVVARPTHDSPRRIFFLQKLPNKMRIIQQIT